MVDARSAGSVVPQRVALAAGNANLGRLVTFCRAPRRTGLLFWLVGPAAPLWAFAVYAAASPGGGRALPVTGTLAALASILLTVRAVSVLAAGRIPTYLFEHGLVQVRYRTPHVITWSQVDVFERGVAPNRKAVATVLHRLVTLDGRTMVLTSRTSTESARLVELTIASVQAAFRPVRPYLGRLSANAQRLSQGKASRLLVVATGFGVVALGTQLERLGMSAPIAAWLAILIAGLLLYTAGYWLSPTLQLGGTLALIIAAVAAIPLTLDRLPRVNVVAVVVAVVAVEALVFVSVRAAASALERGTAVSARRRYARRRGWRFEPTADVDVAGPFTAYQLLGVPRHATTTVGTNVLRGPAGGYHVTVFNRGRLRATRRDPVQTVWAIRLPAAYPIVSATFLDHLDAVDRGEADAGRTEAHTTDPAFALALATSQLRALDVRRTWWVEGDQIVLVDGFVGVFGTTVKQVDDGVKDLLSLMSTIDWRALTSYPAKPLPR